MKSYHVVQKKTTKGWVDIFHTAWKIARWWFVFKYTRKNPKAFLRWFQCTPENENPNKN